jgi:hypothetical protein
MNGRLAAVDITAGSTPETVYEAPDDIRYATLSISVCNRGPDTAQITISGSSVDAAIDTANIIEYRTELLANNVLERTGIIVPQGEFLVVESDQINVSVVVMGAEAT